MRAYTMLLVPAMLVWEVAQLPLYTLWRDASSGTIVYAVLHCTLGDALIGVAALAWALLLAGEDTWPARGFTRVLSATVAVGVAYTLYSEWVNVELRQAWAYTEAMPRLPWLGTGLAPLLQWVVVPPLALLAARRANARGPEAR
ncbi:hypothetical protein KPL78_29900 [Roseomonas sp. HJA6]|uniref:Rod shape-determining protein MreD n=1 Tax=Roseomonas alba TaxID=2846776 RepID=A0ABS7AIT6_9PROT|nr:hypothetical protein [Neoroseomonas alba]MBW6402098.1 hypothetical protein [Neoroseomonas alba]